MARKAFINRVGLRFDGLMVVEYVNQRWKCVCDCGAIRFIASRDFARRTFPCRHIKAPKLKSVQSPKATQPKPPRILRRHYQLAAEEEVARRLPINCRAIILSQGKVALIDAEDYERVSQFKWSAMRVERRGRVLGYYAYRTVWQGTQGKGATQKRIMLHRFILSAPDGIEVDHKNRMPLDCRKSNLRFATRAQQMANTAPGLKSKTGFRCVHPTPNAGTFYFAIKCGQKVVRESGFLSAESAARAHDVRVKELRGEFAVLNFPDE